MAALAHGRPIISTEPPAAVPAPPPLAHAENVWLVPAGVVPDLAEAIRHLSTYPEKREQLAQGAAAVASHFTWERIAARTLTFYRQIMADS